MRTRFAWPLAGCLLLMSAMSGAAPAEDVNSHKNSGPVLILPTPVEYSNEAGQSMPPALFLPGREYKSGSGWWALSCEGGCRLTQSSLIITPQMHTQYDGPMVPGQMMRWSPAPPPHTLLMFKPFRAPADQIKLAAGPVKTYYSPESAPLARPKTDGTLECQITVPDGPDGTDGKVVRLVPVIVLPGKKAVKDVNDEAPPLQLEMHIGDTRQMLTRFEFGIEGSSMMTPGNYVVWAGDLDGDGKLDLIVKTDYAGDGFALFLSSLAKPGELVGEAGRFDYFPIDSPGC